LKDNNKTSLEGTALSEIKVGEEASKLSTWIQVVAAIILGIVQIALAISKPEMAWYGIATTIILALLAVFIVWTDRKTKQEESDLKNKLDKLQNDIPIMQFIAKKQGAGAALMDAEQSFREEAKTAKSKTKKAAYLTAAQLVSRYRRLLQKMQEELKKPL
jgi:hypothetical protein